MEALAERLDLSHVSTSAARFDLGELKALNARFLHATPYDEVAERLAAKGIGDGEAFWLAVRGNLFVFDDVIDWWRVVDQEMAPVVEDAEFLAEAAAVLPAEPWGEATWADWTNAVKAATGAKGKALFMPLRHILTGQAHGPDMATLVPMIGRDRIVQRLKGEAA